MLVKYLLKKVIPSRFRSKIKRIRRRTKNFFKRGVVKVTLDEMRELLVNDFGLSKGDNLIVSSSFGNLNADFSPINLIHLLQEIIGDEGNLIMPFYPPGNSYEWAESGQVFDMKTTRSSMGILTQVFSEKPNVLKSMHPTKAVVVWGKNANEIITGHENSKTPFYWDSPYGWLLKKTSKSIGLGLINMPMFHAIEDTLLMDKINLYQDEIFSLKVRKYDRSIILINTLIHDPKKINKLIMGGQFIQTLDINSYKIKGLGFGHCYAVDNIEAFDRCKQVFGTGNFRFKK